MKKGCKVFLAILLSICCIYTTSLCGLAADIPTVSPQYIGVSDVFVDLSISSSGYASCYSSAKLNNGYTGTLKMSLYREGILVKSWSTSGSSRITLDKGYYVSSGYRYQVIATVTVKNSSGYVVDIVTARTPTQSY